MKREREVFDRLNNFFSKYKPTFEVMGILAGLIVLLLTFWNTLISKDLLQLSQQQEFNKQLPIWDFDIVDSTAIIRLKPFSPEIKIQRANAIYPKGFVDPIEWPIDPPKFEFYVGRFKYETAKLCRELMKYDTNYVSFSFRNETPVGLAINYIQYGQSKTVYGIYKIQYQFLRKSYEPEITIEGMLFVGYYDQKKFYEILESLGDDLKQDIDSLRLKKMEKD